MFETSYWLSWMISNIATFKSFFNFPYSGLKYHLPLLISPVCPSPIFSAIPPKFFWPLPPEKLRSHNIEGFIIYYLKKLFWLFALIVTAQLSLDRICCQLSQPEIEFDVVERCTCYCACTHVKKWRYFWQRRLNHYNIGVRMWERIIGPIMYHSL